MNTNEVSFKGDDAIFFKFLKGTLKKGQGPVDLDKLHQQKLTLIDIAAEEWDAITEDPAHKERAKALDGLVEFLDAFQDMLADNLQIWQYPKEEADAEG